jgi:hypothetical protein
MERSISKAEATAFRERWKAVRAAECAELRATPPALKLKQLIALMSSVEQLGWTEALAAEAAQVRERWCRLRSRLARD